MTDQRRTAILKRAQNLGWLGQEADLSADSWSDETINVLQTKLHLMLKRDRKSSSRHYKTFEYRGVPVRGCAVVQGTITLVLERVVDGDWRMGWAFGSPSEPQQVAKRGRSEARRRLEKGGFVLTAKRPMIIPFEDVLFFVLFNKFVQRPRWLGSRLHRMSEFLYNLQAEARSAH